MIPSARSSRFAIWRNQSETESPSREAMLRSASASHGRRNTFTTAVRFAVVSFGLGIAAGCHATVLAPSGDRAVDGSAAAPKASTGAGFQAVPTKGSAALASPIKGPYYGKRHEEPRRSDGQPEAGAWQPRARALVGAPLATRRPRWA